MNSKLREQPMSDNTQELRELTLNIIPCIDGTCDKHGTAVGGTMDDPEPYQCQFCYEQRFAAADKAVALIKSQTNQAVLEARIDELEMFNTAIEHDHFEDIMENRLATLRQELTQEVQTDE